MAEQPGGASGGLFGCRPILWVADVPASLRHYREQLGFRVGWRWSDEVRGFLEPGDPRPSQTALVGRDNVQLMLVQTRASDDARRGGAWLHLDVDTADALDRLHAEWRERCAQIAEPPTLRVWGMYEMRVVDLDGNVFRVASPPRSA